MYATSRNYFVYNIAEMILFMFIRLVIGVAQFTPGMSDVSLSDMFSQNLDSRTVNFSLAVTVFP